MRYTIMYTRVYFHRLVKNKNKKAVNFDLHTFTITVKQTREPSPNTVCHDHLDPYVVQR